jgi:phosphoribosyl-AMP cyclohydrolase
MGPMAVPTPIAATPEQLAAVRYNADGLVPAIVQEEGTGLVLMMAWMNEVTIRETLESGRTVFWSRSRQARWRKGDTSGGLQWVRAAYYDCDGDTLLFVVEQEGAGACHTGRRSCFYRRFGAETVPVGGLVAPADDVPDDDVPDDDVPDDGVPDGDVPDGDVPDDEMVVG